MDYCLSIQFLWLFYNVEQVISKLMDEIKQIQAEMQEKIGKLQEEVSANQDDVAERIVKKLKVDHGYMFQKKGHEQQFQFNADINEHIQKAQDEADKIKPLSAAEKKVLDKLKTELHKGNQEITSGYLCEGNQMEISNSSGNSIVTQIAD